MEDILIVLLQGFAELFIEIFGSGILDLFTWRGESNDVRISRVWMVALLLFAAGCLLGWLSLLLMPHNLVPWGWLRMANLVIGPAVSGWISWRIARWRRHRDPDAVPHHHAINAVVACLGMVLVRFIWGVR